MELEIISRWIFEQLCSDMQPCLQHATINHLRATIYVQPSTSSVNNIIIV